MIGRNAALFADKLMALSCHLAGSRNFECQ